MYKTDVWQCSTQVVVSVIKLCFYCLRAICPLSLIQNQRIFPGAMTHLHFPYSPERFHLCSLDIDFNIKCQAFMISLIGIVAQSLISIYYRKTEHRENVLIFFATSIYICRRLELTSLCKLPWSFSQKRYEPGTNLALLIDQFRFLL